MEPLTESWIDATKKAIQIIHDQYGKNRGMLLTEGDLECHLFAKLLDQESITGFHETKDSPIISENGDIVLNSTYVHSQVTWFLPEKQSGFEVDLTICDPAKLEVINIELFEEYPHKGFAYDGPCVAIEIKFIIDEKAALTLAHEDYLKLRDRLIPSKLTNIRAELYKISTENNIAFISIVGCKNREIFNKAKKYIGKHLITEGKPCPDNLLICLFYQDEIVWEKEDFIEYYNQNNLPN